MASGATATRLLLPPHSSRTRPKLFPPKSSSSSPRAPAPQALNPPSAAQTRRSSSHHSRSTPNPRSRQQQQQLKFEPEIATARVGGGDRDRGGGLPLLALLDVLHLRAVVVLDELLRRGDALHGEGGPHRRLPAFLPFLRHAASGSAVAAAATAGAASAISLSIAAAATTTHPLVASLVFFFSLPSFFFAASVRIESRR